MTVNGRTDPADLASRVVNGDMRALARLLSVMENDAAAAQPALDRLYHSCGHAHTIGLTGVPGAGKSSLVALLAGAFRRQNQTVAIIAVDPSSPVSGGAILGDRIRMQALAADPGVYIRSMAARGAQGGLSDATVDAIDVLDAAHFDRIIVETLGVGQGEWDICSAVQSTVVVSAPGLGDTVQSIKAGIMETGDIHVVNKADRPDANQTLMDIRTMLHLVSKDRGDWGVPVVGTCALSGEGVEELAAALDRHRDYLVNSGERERRRRDAAELRIWKELKRQLLHRLQDQMDKERLEAVIAQVAARKLSPQAASLSLLKDLGW